MDDKKCAICNCSLHRKKGTYANPSPEGRSHASRHHFIPERFLGRSKNRRGTQRKGIFHESPWGHEKETVVFCYDCHEELLHNPVLFPYEIKRFADLVALSGLSEINKTDSKEGIAGRIILLQKVIDRGLEAMKNETSQQANR